MSHSDAFAALTRFGTPFRVGSTSYLYPDDLLLNVQRLAEGGEVDDIELILFEVDDGPNNLPSEAIVEQMRELACLHHLTYTVHLPLDLQPGADASTLHKSLKKAERVIKTTAPLIPYACVFHLDGEGMADPGWLSRSLGALEVVMQWVADPGVLAVENLESYPPDLLDVVLDALPISRAVDIGHLWKQGRDPLKVLHNWLQRARVIHLHGPGTRDHQSLALMQPDQLDPIVAALLTYNGVVTLEVFETADFFSSREALLASVQRVLHG
jgi:sugar phosphate isomerase/epimerase